MTDVVTTVPQVHLDHASALLPAEQAVATLGPGLQDALDRFVRECPDGGFCPALRGEDLTRHAERGRVLTEWVAAIGQAFSALDDGFVGYLPGAARSETEDAITAWVEALGAFPLLEQAEAWRAGIAHASTIEDLITAGEGQQAADALATLADFEDNPVYLRAALLALGDLDDLEDRIDAVTDRGNPIERFLGGAWDATSGGVAAIWGLSGQALHDPRGWAGNWGELGSGLWWGVRNPDDFALAVVDWDGFQEDPVRWAGQLMPDVAAALFTGGSATAATRGASATRAAVRGLRTATRLSDRVAALRHLATALQVDVAGRVRTIGGRAVTWTPVGFVDEAGHVARVSVGGSPGPLSRLSDMAGMDLTDTFRSGQYVTRRTTTDTVLYRVGAPGRPLGSFWTRISPTGATQATIDSALQPAWRNPATVVTEIRVPRGETVYEGLVAPQPVFAGGSPAPTSSGLVGGGPQVYLPNVQPDWITSSYRVSGDDVTRLFPEGR